MKSVLSGNEALVRGAWEAGVRFATAYPGTPSTEILENCGRCKEIVSQWSVNEKVAVEAGAGAAIGGARSLVAMKHVGLNVAADPLFTLSYVGVNAGLVIVTADDPEMHSSQNEQDNRHYARAAKVPMLEPADSTEALVYVKAAFELSEKYDVPVLLRMTTRICHAQGVVEISPRVEVPLKDYVKDFVKRVMLPVNARKRHPVVEKRLVDLLREAGESDFNRIEWGDRKVGFVTSGVSYQYVKEAFPEASVLKYGFTWPFNANKALEFARGVEKLYVVEEGDPFLEQNLILAGVRVDGGKDRTGLLGELNVDRLRDAFGGARVHALQPEPGLPARPPALCAGCTHRGLFHALAKEKATIFGDIGCYSLAALPPLSAMDTLICMGASISASIGLVKARPGEKRKMACVIGDGTFIHSGITGLIDAVHNRAAFVTCILDNRVTAMTGHQNNPNTGKTLSGEDAPTVDLEGLVRACGIRKLDVLGAYDGDAIRETLKRHWELDEPSVVIVRQPCIEWKRWREPKYEVDARLCTDCGVCLKLGCPAISRDEERGIARIDPDLCVGCGFCESPCKFKAIYASDKLEAHVTETAGMEPKGKVKRGGGEQ